MENIFKIKPINNNHKSYQVIHKKLFDSIKMWEQLLKNLFYFNIRKQ